MASWEVEACVGVKLALFGAKIRYYAWGLTPIIKFQFSVVQIYSIFEGTACEYYY
jgi:hypothetical protein